MNSTDECSAEKPWPFMFKTINVSEVVVDVEIMECTRRQSENSDVACVNLNQGQINTHIELLIMVGFPGSSNRVAL